MTVRSTLTRLALSLLVTGALAGCGKRGNPAPPGPADQVTYPKTYPTH